jgi:hypothetical protein
LYFEKKEKKITQRLPARQDLAILTAVGAFALYKGVTAPLTGVGAVFAI